MSETMINLDIIKAQGLNQNLCLWGGEDKDQDLFEVGKTVRDGEGVGARMTVIAIKNDARISGGGIERCPRRSRGGRGELF